MADSQTSDTSPPRFQRGGTASDLLREVSFPLAVRGYDRDAVNDFVNQLRALVADLEANQTREGVVQRALDELGTETAGILQRAHETADEIAARSRAQADTRLQRAEREAEIARREADEYSEQVVVDTRLLWEDRQRLIEDIRQLADEVLATADDAMERVKMPEQLGAADEEPPIATDNVPGPIGLTPAEANGPPPLEQVEPDASWGLGVVDNGPVGDEETVGYELGAVEDDAAGAPAGDDTVPYDFQDAPPEDETEPYTLGAVEDEPAEDDSPGTVELEALPGGEEGQPAEPEPGVEGKGERD